MTHRRKRKKCDDFWLPGVKSFPTIYNTNHFALRSNNFQPLLFLNLVQNEVDIFGYISGNAMPEFQQISKE